MFEKLLGKSPATTVAKATEQLERARRNLVAAQEAHSTAVFENAEGDAQGHESNAEAKLNEAEKAVRRLEIVLSEARKAEAKDAAKRQLDQAVASDRAFDTDLVKHAETAGKLAAATKAFADAYEAHHQSESVVRRHASGNRRVRQDLLIGLASTASLVGKELARVTAGRKVLPVGTNVHVTVTGNPAELMPLVDQIAQDHRALREGLHV